MDRASSPIRFWRHAEFVCRVATALIGAFLFAAAVSKALRPEEAEIALGYLIGVMGVPAALTPAVFQALLLCEILVGSALLFDLWPRAAVAAAVMLLCCFSAWALYLMVSRADVPCGCGVRTPWGGGVLSPAEVLTRNIVLIAILLGSRLVLMRPNKRSGQGRGRADPAGLPGSTTGPP